MSRRESVGQKVLDLIPSPTPTPIKKMDDDAGPPQVPPTGEVQAEAPAESVPPPPSADQFIQDPGVKSLYRCRAKEGCTYTSPSRQNMIRHVCTHKKDGFVCPEEGCGRAFTMRAYLTQHQEVEHEGIRYVCKSPGCTYVCKARRTMLRHDRAHGGGMFGGGRSNFDHRRVTEGEGVASAASASAPAPTSAASGKALATPPLLQAAPHPPPVRNNPHRCEGLQGCGFVAISRKALEAHQEGRGHTKAVKDSRLPGGRMEGLPVYDEQKAISDNMKELSRLRERDRTEGKLALIASFSGGPYPSGGWLEVPTEEGERDGNAGGAGSGSGGGGGGSGSGSGGGGGGQG